jgi:hypothetical protein
MAGGNTPITAEDYTPNSAEIDKVQQPFCTLLGTSILLNNSWAVARQAALLAGYGCHFGKCMALMAGISWHYPATGRTSMPNARMNQAC